MKIKQKTIVEKMKPLFPSLTQPICSAVIRKQAGIQWTNRFRREAEKQGVMFHHDADGRAYGHKHGVRLTDSEDKLFRIYLKATGQTAQDYLHKLLVPTIQYAAMQQSFIGYAEDDCTETALEEMRL